VGRRRTPRRRHQKPPHVRARTAEVHSKS
jgi:hypothetical protein